MNTPALLFLGGALLGAALAVFCAPFLTAVPRLGPALERLAITTPTTTHDARTRPERLGAWLHHHLPALKALTVPAADLELLGTTPALHLYRKAVSALAGFLALGLSGTLMQLIGGFPLAVPVGFALLGAAVLWWVPDLALTQQATRARRDFARAVAVYLELVATERRRDAPPAVALERAAAVSDAWIFRRISEELTRARLDHTPAWEALITFSRKIGVPELEEAARIMRLSGREGAHIYQSLRTAGKALRVKLLAEEQAAANRASERMTLFISLLAMAFMGVIITPLLLNLA